MTEQTALVKSEPRRFTVAEIKEIGASLAIPQMFGKTADQMIALCIIADAEGVHPAMAAMDYDIIKGKPALKANSLLARFQAAGGTVNWTEMSDDSVTGIFEHPQGGKVSITWDAARIKTAQLDKKDNHIKYPQQMKRARCISEGVRAVFPGAAKFYVPEEVVDFSSLKNITADVTATDPTTKKKETPASKPTVKPASKTANTEKTVNINSKVDEARKAAAARTEAPPIEQPNNSFPAPTGVMLKEEEIMATAKAFETHGVDLLMLEAWRMLNVDKWTTSVQEELRELFRLFKSGGIDKAGLEEIIRA